MCPFRICGQRKCIITIEPIRTTKVHIENTLISLLFNIHIFINSYTLTYRKDSNPGASLFAYDVTTLFECIG